jgi:hypothetical protein
MSCGRTMPGNPKGEPTLYGGKSTKADLVIRQTSPPIGTSTANAARIPRVLGMQRVSITLALKLHRRSKRRVLTLGHGAFDTKRPVRGLNATPKRVVQQHHSVH